MLSIQMYRTGTNEITKNDHREKLVSLPKSTVDAYNKVNKRLICGR